MPMLNMRYVIPDHMIDLNRIPGLDAITFDAKVCESARSYGKEQSSIMPELRARAPVFAEALAHVGHYQTRSRGTVGGSLCHLDPAAELVLLASLHGAVMHVTGRNGPRENWHGFLGGGLYGSGAVCRRGPNGDHLSFVARASGEAFLEFARRRGDFALASVGVRVALTGRPHFATCYCARRTGDCADPASAKPKLIWLGPTG